MQSRHGRPPPTSAKAIETREICSISDVEPCVLAGLPSGDVQCPRPEVFLYYTVYSLYNQSAGTVPLPGSYLCKPYISYLFIQLTAQQICDDIQCRSLLVTDSCLTFDLKLSSCRPGRVRPSDAARDLALVLTWISFPHGRRSAVFGRSGSLWSAAAQAQQP